MRVALLGNMNNNNFSIMRYFRDLGIDAHLVLFENDGYKSNSHFIPENDTWEYDKWEAYIHKVNIFNGYGSVIGHKFPYNFLFVIAYAGFKLINKDIPNLKPVSEESIKAALNGYDCYIGSGLSATLLRRINKKLDIFYPYATGIEYLGTELVRKKIMDGSYVRRKIIRETSEVQKQAIRDAQNCITAELSLTKTTFDEIDVPIVPMAIPMVYNKGTHPPKDQIASNLLDIIKDIESNDFTIINHSRQMWVNPGDFTNEEWRKQSKHNEWLIKGFAKYLKNRPNVRSKLFILEYGTDVKDSKLLCEELGIQESVRWLPKMTRKELLLLISKCSIGVDQFSIENNSLWGGSGWEVLASGKPLLQSFMFEEGEFEKKFDQPAPPMLKVKSESCIVDHLLDISDNPEKGRKLGEAAKNWFNKYNGISLAQKWIELLEGK